MSIVFGRRRLEKVEAGHYDAEDVKALARAIRRLEAFADGRVLSITVGVTTSVLSTPDEIIRELEEGLK